MAMPKAQMVSAVSQDGGAAAAATAAPNRQPTPSHTCGNEDLLSLFEDDGDMFMPLQDGADDEMDRCEACSV